MDSQGDRSEQKSRNQTTTLINCVMLVVKET
jgi:hypothetical protein